jgi:RHS repeat-associated protein
MRTGSGTGATGLNWLLSDHLGSQALTISANGATEEGEVRYKAWGEDRSSTGATPTSFRYTGQRSEMGGLGLYIYGARFYDPVNSRFISADTIIPGAGEVQAWDRYAATSNNPANRIDPSGHMDCENDGYCPDAWLENDPPPNPLVELIDEFLWDNVPSAVGYNIGVSGQTGAVIEPGIVPIEATVLFNWRAGELSVITSSEAFLYAGTPSLLGGNGYFGYTEVYGASSNDYLRGPSAYGGVTASADAFSKFGVNAIGGRSVTPLNETPPQWFIDPESKHPIEYHQLDITFGGNLGSNAIDVGGVGGVAYTQIRWTYAIPGWPLR